MWSPQVTAEVWLGPVTEGHKKWLTCSYDILSGGALLWHSCYVILSFLPSLCTHSQISLNFSMLNDAWKRSCFMTVLSACGFFPLSNPILNELLKWKATSQSNCFRIKNTLGSYIWICSPLFHFSLFDLWNWWKRSYVLFESSCFVKTWIHMSFFH